MSGYVWKGKQEPPPTTVKCGTNSGYTYHYKNEQTPCEPCRQARIEYKRQYKSRTRARTFHASSEGTQRLLIAAAESAEWDRRRRTATRKEVNHDNSNQPL